MRESSFLHGTATLVFWIVDLSPLLAALCLAFAQPESMHWALWWIQNPTSQLANNYPNLTAFGYKAAAIMLVSQLVIIIYALSVLPHPQQSMSSQ
jgi:hypothetical protein